MVCSAKSAFIDQSDLEMLAFLRKNARQTLTKISKETGIPISSTFDRLKRLEGIGIIRSYTSIFDWEKVGFHTRVVILLKTRDNIKDTLECWLKEYRHINNLMRINGEWNFVAEALFRDIKSLEEFMESLSENFEGIQSSVNYVLEDIKREGFTPEL